MPTKTDFENAAKLAIKNITNHGDTDIFPFPFERFVFQDNEIDVLEVIIEYNENFESYLARYSPFNVSALTPVNYFGFRWATQIDYIWNAVFLAFVLVLRKKIEAARVPIDQDCVHSYRLSTENKTGALFDKKFGFQSFIKSSKELAKEFNYVVLCDISEFYPRLGHHRLENALKQIDGSSEYPKRIMDFLSNFSRTNSFGLPIGGPAARILSELTINQIDRLLIGRGIKFTRFADDYHIFATSREEAYNSLIFLSEKLSLNQGLTLQKSKTRIMSSAEFLATAPTIPVEEVAKEATAPAPAPEKAGTVDPREILLAFSLRFDPYSPNAQDDYDRLKTEIRKYDILAILKEELGKTRVHTTLTKKLVQSIQYLEPKIRDQAVLSVIENSDVLYPIFSSILVMIEQLIDDLSPITRAKIKDTLVQLIQSDSHIFRVDVHLCYAVRVLSHFNEPEVIALLQKIYEQRTSPIIRRDIILTLARCAEWYWLSDIKNNFRQLSAPERRAFIVASYTLQDEGKHWREHSKSEFNPYELKVLKWAGGKAGAAGWRISH